MKDPLRRLVMVSAVIAAQVSCSHGSMRGHPYRATSQFDPRFTLQVTLEDIDRLRGYQERIVREIDEQIRSFFDMWQANCQTCTVNQILIDERVLADRLQMEDAKAVNALIQMSLNAFLRSRGHALHPDGSSSVDLQIISLDPSLIEARITNVRGEVIPGKLWEVVEIQAIVVPAYDGFKVHWTVDGRYGLGLLPPTSEEESRDMEPRFAADLQRYCRSLAAFSQSYLQRWLGSDPVGDGRE